MHPLSSQFAEYCEGHFNLEHQVNYRITITNHFRYVLSIVYTHSEQNMKL